MVISTHNIATGDGLYRAAAWAVLVRMYCDTVVVAVAVAIGMVSVLFWNLLLTITYVVCMNVLHLVYLQRTSDHIYRRRVFMITI